jgi:hypothetical protein
MIIIIIIIIIIIVLILIKLSKYLRSKIWIIEYIMKIKVFWDVTPHLLVNYKRCFEEV